MPEELSDWYEDHDYVYAHISRLLLEDIELVNSLLQLACLSKQRERCVMQNYANKVPSQWQ